MANTKIPTGDNKDNKHKQELQQKQIRSWVSFMIVNLIGIWLFQQFILTPVLVREIAIPYSEFKSNIAAGRIVEATLGQDRIVGTMKNPDATDTKNPTVPFTTNAVPDGDPTLIPALDRAGVKYSVSDPPSPLGNFLLAYGLPLALIGGLWYMGSRQMAGGGMGAGGIFGVGKSKATEVKPESVGVTFKDVGGADEAIGELQEIIQFLKDAREVRQSGWAHPQGRPVGRPSGYREDAIGQGHRR